MPPPAMPCKITRPFMHDRGRKWTFLQGPPSRCRRRSCVWSCVGKTRSSRVSPPFPRCGHTHNTFQARCRACFSCSRRLCDTLWCPAGQFRSSRNRRRCRHHPHFRCQLQVGSPQVTHVCPTWLQFKVPRTSLLRFHPVLEQLTEPGETLPYAHLFIIR